jgi:hypothetical protein
VIDRREILESASALSLQPGVVEKDYDLGWLLAGIYAHPELVDQGGRRHMEKQGGRRAQHRCGRVQQQH